MGTIFKQNAPMTIAEYLAKTPEALKFHIFVNDLGFKLQEKETDYYYSDLTWCYTVKRYGISVSRSDQGYIHLAIYCRRGCSYYKRASLNPPFGIKEEKEFKQQLDTYLQEADKLFEERKNRLAWVDQLIEKANGEVCSSSQYYKTGIWRSTQNERICLNVYYEPFGRYELTVSPENYGLVDKMLPLFHKTAKQMLKDIRTQLNDPAWV